MLKRISTIFVFVILCIYWMVGDSMPVLAESPISQQYQPEAPETKIYLPLVMKSFNSAYVTVGGIVINTDTNTPVSGITVRLFYGFYGGSPYYTTTSDGNGLFSFLNIPPGIYAINPYPSIGYIGSGRIITVGTDNIDNLVLTIFSE